MGSRFLLLAKCVLSSRSTDSEK